MDRNTLKTTEQYVDRVIGEGLGRRHVRFLDRIENATLRSIIHGYHAVEADESNLSVDENYLIGMCVLFATKDHGTATMFAKVLVHRGVKKERILEAVARLSMWIGGVAATEAAFLAQKAIREYERDGLASMAI
jgi:hypothetical protein